MVSGAVDLDRVQVMLWDKSKAVWQQVPEVSDTSNALITAKTADLGIIGLMEDVRPIPQFSDISHHWAGNTINMMAAGRIVNGYPDGRYLPNRGVTRAEFVTLLAKTLRWSLENPVSGFNDEIPSWAVGSIGAAVGRGVVQGYPDGTFKPGRNISRAEMAVIMDKALNLPDSNQPSNYKDWRDIQPWAIQAIRDTKETGIMQGSEGLFRPKETANRAEAAAVMSRILEYYVEN